MDGGKHRIITKDKRTLLIPLIPTPRLPLVTRGFYGKYLFSFGLPVKGGRVGLLKNKKKLNQIKKNSQKKAPGIFYIN